MYQNTKSQEENLLSIAVNMLNNNGYQGYRLKEYVDNLKCGQKLNIERKIESEQLENTINIQNMIDNSIRNNLQIETSIQDGMFGGKVVNIKLYYKNNLVSEDESFL